MNIHYKVNHKLTAEQFKDILLRSDLFERRPIENLVCLQGMIENSNLVVSAWDQDKLIGIARSVTDFHYACYLSDLAVDREYQGCGIGRQLVIETQDQLQDTAKIILLAAPNANEYYPKIGFTVNPRAWVLTKH